MHWPKGARDREQLKSAAGSSILRGPRDELDAWTRHRSGPNSLGAKNQRWTVQNPRGPRAEPSSIHAAASKYGRTIVDSGTTFTIEFAGFLIGDFHAKFSKNP